MNDPRGLADAKDRAHRFGPRRPPTPPDVSGLERLLAHEEIRQLAARYALAIDARDMEAVVELFVDDVKAAPGRRGRAALQEVLTPMLRLERMSFLNIGARREPHRP